MYDSVSLELGQSKARELRDALGLAVRELNDMILRAPSELTRRERAKFVQYCEGIAERLDMLSDAISDVLDELPEETEDQKDARWPRC